MAKEYTDVTPSGVKFTVRNFIGEDYDILTKKSNQTDGSGFNKLCARCLLKLGDKENFTENDIKRMLSNDRKYILLKARMHTMRFREEFSFTYEFPAKDGRKMSQKETIIWNDESFPVRPYSWVQEWLKNYNDLQDDFEEAVNENNDGLIMELQAKLDNYKSKLIPGCSFPELYSNYQELELDDGKWETLKLEDKEIQWKYLTGIDEERFAKIDPNSITINTTLSMHSPKIKTRLQNDNMGINEDQLINYDIKRADVFDNELINKDILEKEGEVNTSIVIENKHNGEQVRVDLLTTTAFFLPSQAL